MAMESISVMNTILYCQRWQEVVGFYRDDLGLAVTLEKDWFIEFRINDGACLSVADQRRASVSSSAGQGLTLTFKIEDLEVLHAHLRQIGRKPEAILRHSWGGRSFFVFDPEGNRLEFWAGQ